MKKRSLLIYLSLVFLCTVVGAQEIPSYQITNSDNAEGWRMDSVHYYDFDDLVNDSIMFWRDIYSINEYGQKSSIITYWRDAGLIWGTYMKQEFIYDEWQNEIIHNTYGWNSVSSTWEIMDRIHKHYHPGDTLIESSASAVLDGTVWKKQDSAYYTRDELNRIDSVIEFFWSSGSSSYEPTKISRKVYNTNNLVQSDTSYIDDNNSWQLYVARNMYYNGAGNIFEGIRIKWNESSQEWKNEDSIAWSYDANQNPTLIESFDWDEISSEWVYEMYFIQTFDNNGNLDLMRQFTWNEDLQEIEKGVTGDHFWGLHIFIGMEELSTSQALKVFPNPAIERVNVYVDEDCELMMLNMSGQQVLSATLTKGNNIIKLSDYPNGTFLLRTSGTKESASFKLLISR